MRLLLAICLIISQSTLAADKESVIQQSPLPEVNVSNYAEQLKTFQELQRENFELKLKAQNDELKKKSGNNNVDKITVLTIYSSGRTGYVAKIYGGGAGLRIVKAGDTINDDIHVVEINQRKVTVFSSINNKKQILKPYTIGGG